MKPISIGIFYRPINKIKSTKLHIDEELYKESTYLAMKLIKEKKKKFYKEE